MKCTASQNNCNYWRKNFTKLHVSNELWPSQLIIGLWKLHSISRGVLVCSHKLQQRNKKMQVFIKIGFMLGAAQLIICYPKWKIYEKYWKSYSQEQTEHVYCHSFEFLHTVTYFANFIYSELPNSIQAEAYSEPYQRLTVQSTP